MPLQSREVVTLHLIFECADEENEETLSQESSPPSSLLSLPVELRLKILRYLLRIDRNRKTHTRRAESNSIHELLRLDPRRILDAAPFRHRGNQEINGSPPVMNTCRLYPAVLKTCRQLYWEGKMVLYVENRVVGLQSGIKGLGAKLRNYGVPVWGPLDPSRLVNFSGNDSESNMSKFDPVMLFSGQNAKATTPSYICSYKDSADFVHALWIMIKCPFARGMRYNLTLSAEPRFRHAGRTDSFVKCAVLPWLHNRVNSINFHQSSSGVPLPKAAEERLTSIRNELRRHGEASKIEPNVHLYTSICSYLEQVMLQADLCVEKANFLSAELLYERVCYEASSIVRTRTSELVDVSRKSKDGINRICKLIAVSAFRLCELRSGSKAYLPSQLLQQVPSKDKLPGGLIGRESPALDQNMGAVTSEETVRSSLHATSDRDTKDDATDDNTKHLDGTLAPLGDPEKTVEMAHVDGRSPPSFPRTTRLEPQLARELAITSGLLALRLPCATPLSEWNIRLDIMLLRLFAERNDVGNAEYTVRRILGNFSIVWKEAKAKSKMGRQWQALGTLVAFLTNEMQPSAPRTSFFRTADRCQQVVTGLWGERLAPRKGYIGLIWTFRWAA